AETVRENELAARSIAVLPFLNLDTIEANRSLADSFAQALAARMSGLGVARVVAKTDGIAATPGAGTLADLRKIERQAGVRTVLTGTLRRVGDKCRISLRLSDAQTGDTLFARAIDTNPSAPASEAACLLAKELFAAISGSQPRTVAVDPAAVDPVANEFLRAGDELLGRGTIADIDRSIDCYLRAIDVQPKSARARAAFVIAVVNRAALSAERPGLIGKAEQYGREAVALNKDIESTHRALESLLFLQGKFVQAREEALREMEAGGFLYGSVGLSLIDKMCGRPDLALRWSAICSHWSSRPADCESIAGDCWAALGDDTKAEAHYRRVSDLYPETPEGWIGLCRVKLLQGNFSVAKTICSENVARYPDYRFAREMAGEVEFFSRNFTEADHIYGPLENDDPAGGGSFYGSVSYQSAIGRAMQEMGDAASEDLLKRCLRVEEAALRMAPGHPTILYRVAAIESSLGQIESSLAHLKSAFAAGWLDYRSLGLDPRFDRLREDIRYRGISEVMATRVASLRRFESPITNDYKTNRRKKE
ncbi:MAG: FlgO family outer membrane protein, partial [Acidobacteriota bacterium]